MNKIDILLKRYFFMFPILILLLNLNGFADYIRQFIGLVIMPTLKTTGIITSVERVDAENGTFFDCNIKYSMFHKNYILPGTISFDDRKDVKISDSIAVRVNQKYPTRATIKSVVDLISEFCISLFIIIWSLHGMVILTGRVKRFYYKK